MARSLPLKKPSLGRRRGKAARSGDRALREDGKRATAGRPYGKCETQKKVRRIRRICEFAEPFYLKQNAAAGRGQAAAPTAGGVAPASVGAPVFAVGAEQSLERRAFLACRDALDSPNTSPAQGEVSSSVLRPPDDGGVVPPHSGPHCHGFALLEKTGQHLIRRPPRGGAGKALIRGFGFPSQGEAVSAAD